MDRSIINTREVCEKHSRLSERQLLHIRDCARALLENSFLLGDDETEAPISSAAFTEEYRNVSSSLFCTEMEKSLSVSSEFISSCGRSFATECRALLCRYLTELSQNTSKPINSDMFLPHDTTHPEPKIAYVKNAYSEAAYRIFSSALPRCTVSYPDSFASACEEVYNNRAGFCILPYETSDDGALSGFRQLIIKYELVQVMSCSVSLNAQNGSSRSTRFALLSKDPCPHIIPKAAPRFLKIIIDNPSSGLLSDIYAVAEFNGLRHVKSESTPVAWDSERYSCAVTFSLGMLDPAAFLLYLALEVPQATADSIYGVV